MEDMRLYRNFLCIDLKSFFASVECIERGLDPFKISLVVADTSRGDGSVCLAMTPHFKEKYKMGGRPRLYELPKDKDIMIVKPRMNKYVDYSAKIINIYNKFVSLEDMHIYSVDECFLDVTDYLSFYKMTDYELAKEILKQVLDETGLVATCGIGSNMLLSKLSLDIESKHNDDYIAKWSYEDVKTKLWNVSPLSDMWGIGVQMEKHLNQMGFNKIGDIANASFELLKLCFGVKGEELWMHTNGIDLTNIRQKVYTHAKSIGKGQTLFSDYSVKDAKIVILEIIDSVCSKLRLSNAACRNVNISIGYSKKVGGGFSRQKTIPLTNDQDIITKTIFDLYDKFIEDLPIRKISISLGKLESDRYITKTIFDFDNDNKRNDLYKAIDDIKVRFGNSSILRARSTTDKGTAKLRNKMVGGHNAE